MCVDNPTRSVQIVRGYPALVLMGPWDGLFILTLGTQGYKSHKTKF